MSWVVKESFEQFVPTNTKEGGGGNWAKNWIHPPSLLVQKRERERAQRLKWGTAKGGRGGGLVGAEWEEEERD